MKKILLLLAFVVISFASFAQTLEGMFPYYEKEKVKKADLRKTNYAIASDADAVVLEEHIRITPSFVYAESYLKKGLVSPMTVTETTWQKIKILTDEGVAKANVVLESQEQNVNYDKDSFEAYSYNLEGNKVVKNRIALQSVNIENLNDGTTRVSFEIPNVKSGSIIEYGYTKSFIASNSYYDRLMQSNMPKLKSVCYVTVDEKYQKAFHSIVLGGVDMDINKNTTLDWWTSPPVQYGKMTAQNSISFSHSRGGGLTYGDTLFTTYAFSVENLPALQSSASDAAAGVKVLFTDAAFK